MYFFRVGHDGPDSKAFCMYRGGCQALCTKLRQKYPDESHELHCKSIDLHRSSPRCYLNFGKCNNFYRETITEAHDYVLLVPRNTSNGRNIVLITSYIQIKIYLKNKIVFLILI